MNVCIGIIGSTVEHFNFPSRIVKIHTSLVMFTYSGVS